MSDTLPMLIEGTVYSIDRCPQCGVAKPLITVVGKPAYHWSDRVQVWWHFTASCSRCSRHILFYGWNRDSNSADEITVQDIYPALEKVADELPERARKYLQQAVESRHAPDGALMLAASSIDAMLKEKGHRNGTLYKRIEEAAATGLLTEQMRDWAHEIRLSANEPRHADDEFDGATESDADQAIQFAKALAEYLFVLPARVQKWKAVAAPN